MPISNQELSETALDGWLGRVCKGRLSDFPLSVAWPALVTAASVHVPGRRCNLYTIIIGRPGDGKTVCDKQAMWLMSSDTEPLCVKGTVGSGEGLMRQFGDADSRRRLMYQDELSEFMGKSRIESSSLGAKLNELWSEDKISNKVKKQKECLECDVRLSLLGNLVSDRFDDAFHSGTINGFYRRVLFGEWPSDIPAYIYSETRGSLRAYTPKTIGTPEFENEREPVSVEFSDDVWIETRRWAKDEGIDPATIEPCLRVATICASFDNRPLLQAKDLGPTLALLKYQKIIRQFRKPNEGENADAVLCNKIMDFLRRSASNGEPLKLRDVLRGINAYTRFGPGMVAKAIAALQQQRLIIQSTVKSNSPTGRSSFIALSGENQ